MSETTGEKREEVEGEEAGTVDTERGRAAYSSAEKAYSQFGEQAYATQHGREHQQSLEAENLRLTTMLNSAHAAQVISLNTITNILFVTAATANGGNDTSFISALAEQMAKNGGNTPPVTVAPVKGE